MSLTYTSNSVCATMYRKMECVTSDLDQLFSAAISGSHDSTQSAKFKSGVV